MSGVLGRWSELNHHVRHIIVNALIGLCVVVAVHVAQGLGLFSVQADRGVDFMLRLQAGQDRVEIPPFVFIDVDSDTHLSWGEPLFTPREKIAELLDFALGSEALGVLVDIDLNLDIDNTPVEKVLKRHLVLEKHKVPLILMKTFREPGSNANPDYRVLRRSSLDQLVASTPHYHWANPLFEAEGDFVVRRWRQWVAGCEEEQQQPVMVPSSQLLMVALARDNTAESLYEAMRGILPDSCDQWPEARANSLETSVIAGGHEIHWHSSDLQRLIMYNLRWQPTSAMPNTSMQIDGQAVSVKSVSTIPARLITDSTQLDPAMLAQRFVIIGNSSQFAGDLHPTPLGVMPGSLVVINAIQSLFAIGEVEPPSIGVVLLIELVLLVAISLVFTHYTPGVAAFLSTAVVVLVVFPASIFFFKQGVWLDFSLPIIAVQIHELIAIAETKFRSRKEMLNEANS